MKSIIKFFKDWWPAMLAGYLLFGNALSGFALGLLKNLVVWSAKLLATVIPALMKAMAAMGPLGWGLLATGAVVGGGMYLANRNKNKEGEGDDTNVEATGDEEVQKMNKGGVVPGSGNTDTVPAILTPGEFVMSKGAVQQYGVQTLEGMNAAAGGTNKPEMGRYKGGGKAAGVVTDPKVKQQQEAYMLKFVNEERALQGLEPLTNLTYAPGVELTKPIGKEYFGAGIKETSDTNMDLDKGIKTISRTKTRGDESISDYSVSQVTDEDRQKFFAENPHAQPLLDLKNQAELDNLGASISSSAKMNGGGLVQNFNNGGLVQYFQGGGQVRRVQMGRGAAKRRMEANKIQPIKKPKVIVAYEQEKQNMTDKPNTEKSSSEIPNFNVIAMRSVQKIKVLGISV